MPFLCCFHTILVVPIVLNAFALIKEEAVHLGDAAKLEQVLFQRWRGLSLRQKAPARVICGDFMTKLYEISRKGS